MLQLEQLERMALADRQALLTRGATKDLPSVLTAQTDFDEWLAREPQERKPMAEADVISLEERMALGVA